MRTTRSSMKNTRSGEVAGVNDDKDGDHPKPNGTKKPERQESSEGEISIPDEGNATSLEVDVESSRVEVDTSSSIQKDEAKDETSSSMQKDEMSDATNGTNHETSELDANNESEIDHAEKVGAEDKSHTTETAETKDQPSTNENTDSTETLKENGGRPEIEVEVTSKETQNFTPLKHDLEKKLEASNSKNNPAGSNSIIKPDQEDGGDETGIQGQGTIAKECTLDDEEQCKEQETSKAPPNELTKCKDHMEGPVDPVVSLSSDDNKAEKLVNPAEVTDVDNATSNPEESSDSESSDKSGTDEVDDDNETWDLKSVFSLAAISKSRATKCYTEGCSLVAACQYVSNKNETWYTCLDCQEEDFGGWPEADELPMTSLSKDHENILAKKCSSKKSPIMPCFNASIGKISTKKENQNDVTVENHENIQGDEDIQHSSAGVASSSSADDASNQSAAEETWDLTKILEPSAAEQIKCSNEGCSLAAAAIWISTKNPNTKWYTCIDCQEEDFYGWPEDVDNLPLKSITNEHRRSLAKYCSNKASPNLPALPLQDQGDFHPSDKQGNVTGPDDDGKKLSTEKESLRSSKPSKPSASALALHRKWQEAAIAMGGPDARIIVSKLEAKKLVFDLLQDAFQPMNITQIHKELKALVPSPILKSCLDDMILEGDKENPFDDSDGDGDCTSPRKISIQPYAGSLFFKSGKKSNSCLYYVDYSKLENGGNGLDSEERNLLMGKLAESESAHRLLDKNVQTMTMEASKLQSEPTNQELVSQLAQQEPQISVLLEEVESARELKVNEKHKKQTKRRIDVMTSEWRRRKRLCTDFLISIEEMTEGTINMKKCMKGDGKIYIESDETILRNAREFGEKKRRLQREGQLGKPKRKGRLSIGTAKRAKLQSSSSIPGDDNFIGVTLDSKGVAKREYVSQEDDE